MLSEWQKRDARRSATVAQAPERRDAVAEAENVARMTAIDSRNARSSTSSWSSISRITPRSRAPRPLSVEEVQAQLGADEALVLLFQNISPPKKVAFQCR